MRAFTIRFAGGAPGRIRPAALAVVLVLIASTVFATNHCKLGGMKPVAAEAHSCCTPGPSEADAPFEYSQCCAPLEVPLPSLAQAPGVQFTEIFAAWPDVEPTVPAAAIELRVISRANAPPGRSPLLELVLRRDVPAHAPPAFVV